MRFPKTTNEQTPEKLHRTIAPYLEPPRVGSLAREALDTMVSRLEAAERLIERGNELRDAASFYPFAKESDKRRFTAAKIAYSRERKAYEATRDEG